MRAPRGHQRRTPAKWLVRGAVALLALVIGGYSFASSLAASIVSVDSGKARMLAPANGIIAAKAAEQEFAIRPNADSNSSEARLARFALMQEPTAVNGASLLGRQAQLRGDSAAARRFMVYALRLSRRELPSRFFAIEDAANRGDIDGALVNFDISLRTSRSAAGVLFPVLASALGEPTIATRLVTLVRKAPPWADDLLQFLSTSGVDPQAAVGFYQRFERAGGTIDSDRKDALMETLVVVGKGSAAWDYYRQTNAGVDRTRSRQPGFAAAANNGAPFDWNLVEQSGISAGFLSGAESGFEFSAAPSVGGETLRQLQALPPGQYDMRSTSSGITAETRALPYWELTCVDGRSLGRMPLGNRGDQSVRVARRVSVPAGCPLQTFSLQIRPSDEMGGVSGTVTSAQIVPAGAAK